MMDRIEALFREMERLVPMVLPERAPEPAIAAAGGDVPAAITAFWRLHDGAEIYVPGTRLFSVEEARQELASPTRDPELYPLGVMNFGDMLYMRRDGQVVQIDHEDGSEFLTWPSLEAYLEDELANCRGEF